jgi:hypothetical protein
LVQEALVEVGLTRVLTDEVEPALQALPSELQFVLWQQSRVIGQ